MYQLARSLREELDNLREVKGRLGMAFVPGRRNRKRDKETFSRVIGLSHRPLSKEAARLPNDPRLELHNRLDLTNRDQTKEKLGSVPGIGNVTHVYFVAYTGHGGSPKDVVNVNATIVDNALIALNELCPKMEFFVLQTGGKASTLL
ncbi:hypothetical protein Neosp_002981 [[Neocosmospora] mangrovei]